MMKYCNNCGSQVGDDDKFCSSCGNELKPNLAKESKRTVSFAGEIYKCPNCGEVLPSFINKCPKCGYEIRNGNMSSSIREFEHKYSEAKSIEDKISLIRTFPVPNTKEDILEFSVLASSNIDEISYIGTSSKDLDRLNNQKLAEAWMSKFDQVYQKAVLLFEEKKIISNIEKSYLAKKKQVYKTEKSRKNNSTGRKVMKWIIYGVSSYLILMLVILLSILIPEKTREKKFEKQVDQIEELINQKEYDEALNIAYSLDDYYDQKGDLISRIFELKGDTEGKAKIPNISLTYRNYTDVVILFKNAGFTDIRTEAVKKGSTYTENEVFEISINGKTNFTKGEYIDIDSIIIIRYVSK